MLEATATSKKLLANTSSHNITECRMNTFELTFKLLTKLLNLQNLGINFVAKVKKFLSPEVSSRIRSRESSTSSNPWSDSTRSLHRIQGGLLMKVTLDGRPWPWKLFLISPIINQVIKWLFVISRAATATINTKSPDLNCQIPPFAAAADPTCQQILASKGSKTSLSTITAMNIVRTIGLDHGSPASGSPYRTIHPCCLHGYLISSNLPALIPFEWGLHECFRRTSTDRCTTTTTTGTLMSSNRCSRECLLYTTYIRSNHVQVKARHPTCIYQGI